VSTFYLLFPTKILEGPTSREPPKREGNNTLVLISTHGLAPITRDRFSCFIFRRPPHYFHCCQSFVSRLSRPDRLCCKTPVSELPLPMLMCPANLQPAPDCRGVLHRSVTVDDLLARGIRRDSTSEDNLDGVGKQWALLHSVLLQLLGRPYLYSFLSLWYPFSSCVLRS